LDNNFCLDTLLKLVLKYSSFAVLAIAVNLAFQYISFIFYSGAAVLYIAMLVGTFFGLITKYILDKKYIFYHMPKNKKDDVQKFMLYSLMGVFTTIIFWGTEILFDTLISADYAKYLGAIIGLSIGYVVKYFLDKKFVFLDGKLIT